MIHFNELRITEDNKQLIIDASIDLDSCFDDVYLSSIIIDNQDTFIDNGPSSNPIFTMDISNTYTEVSIDNQCVSPVYVETEEYQCYIKDNKNIRIILPLIDNNIKSTDMLFVYILTEGTPECSINKSYILGTVVDLYTIYKEIMNHIKEIDCKCSIPKTFIDFVLRLKALELCIKTGNYTQAIKYWNKFNNKPLNNCCYG